MKKFLTLFAISFLIISSSLFSQLTPFFAADQTVKATETAGVTLSNPQLLSIVTENGLTATYMGIDFTNVVINDASTDRGKASFWVYVFNSMDQPDSVQAFVVAITPFAGTICKNIQEFGFSLSMVDGCVVKDKTLNGKTYLNSGSMQGNSMINVLQTSSQYQAFMSANTDGALKLVSLGFADYQPLDPSTPYWFVGLTSAADSTIIIINAETGVVTDVDELNILGNDEIKIYPNPSQDFINIELPFELFNTEISIYDINGNLVKSMNNVNRNHNMNIDIKDLSNGAYNVKYGNQGNSSFLIKR